jgi:hypothetical protein
LAELDQAGVDEVAMSLLVPDNDPAQVMAALEGLAPSGSPVP